MLRAGRDVARPDDSLEDRTVLRDLRGRDAPAREQRLACVVADEVVGISLDRLEQRRLGASFGEVTEADRRVDAIRPIRGTLHDVDQVHREAFVRGHAMRGERSAHLLAPVLRRDLVANRFERVHVPHGGERLGGMCVAFGEPEPQHRECLFARRTDEPRHRAGVQTVVPDHVVAAEDVLLPGAVGGDVVHVPTVDDFEREGKPCGHGRRYFNEACQSYSLEAQGRCSSLVALDPFADAVRWRTPPLISRDVFLVVGEYIVAGYGFTAEADALHLIRRSDGAVVADLSIGIAHDDLTLKPDGTISVLLHDGRERTVRIVTSGRTASLAFVRRSRR